MKENRPLQRIEESSEDETEDEGGVNYAKKHRKVVEDSNDESDDQFEQFLKQRKFVNNIWEDFEKFLRQFFCFSQSCFPTHFGKNLFKMSHGNSIFQTSACDTYQLVQKVSTHGPSRQGVCEKTLQMQLR